ncbi:GSCFA domain-containing protein [Desulfatirhabdium butyrativorans]|uniref:GSCFA domain-containing protein n=1 Tax=Desulfatirhabdium butyrativorans TaxID=340467 RepID=UPI000409A0D2|nr:GSCFA domain-containing protein [Desulfatirhabdium butyrativorans]
MPRSDVHPHFEFEPWQVWPGSYDNPPAPENAYPFPEATDLKIGPATPIASMGSCFAREIKDVLIENGYSYVQEEAGHPASRHASAAWERTYNTFSMRQIFEYTFGEWQPELRWWQAPISQVIQDPYRRIVIYGSVAEAEADFEKHRQASRNVLMQSDVLILSFGLTEIWEDRVDGAVICLPSGPYVNEGGNMDRYRFRVSRYSENLENMERMHELMSEYNPNCRIIVTVSPIHLWATFRKDVDVISASWNSKSTLRAAADEFVCRHSNVFYFPAFEMAMTYRGILGKQTFAEGREPFHVNRETVRFIMDNFFRIYA